MSNAIILLIENDGILAMHPKKSIATLIRKVFAGRAEHAGIAAV